MRREPPATDLNFWLLKPSSKKKAGNQVSTELPKSPSLAKAAEQASKASARYARLAKLHSRFGGEPDAGSVLQFEHTWVSGHAYTYAALHVEGVGWFLGGQRPAGAVKTWDELVEFIGDEECFIATGWQELGGE